jgi:hypothetical protein
VAADHENPALHKSGKGLLSWLNSWWANPYPRPGREGQGASTDRRSSCSNADAIRFIWAAVNPRLAASCR